MELYRLNLHKNIRYTAIAGADWSSIHATAAGLSDRDELLAVLDGKYLVHSDDDGPHAADPLPLPLMAGIQKSGAPAEARAEQESAIGVSLDVATEGLELPACAYLFAQGRYEDTASVHALLDWFIKEAWWQREASEGPYYVRWVREDGKTALQVLRKKV
mgnify:CR=1 FL=1